MPPAISSHVSFAGGNFLASSFSDTNIPQGNPTYIIRHVLHDWTDDEVVHILSNVRQALPPKGGRLLLVEMLLRPDSSRFIRQTSVQLLALNSGITRTQADMEALVVRAGFKVSRVTHMRAADSVIEAVL
jgi:O-methyltransferase domain